MKKSTLCVVDDDYLHARLTSFLVAELGYAVLPPCNTVEQATVYLRKEAPQLFLLDIFMDNGPQGLDFAEELQAHGIPFIFISSLQELSYGQRIQALRPAAFLSKPLNALSLSVAIHQALAQQAQTQPPEPPPSIFVKDGYQQKRVNVSDILFLQSEHNYVAFHLTQGRKILQRGTLDSLAKTLCPRRFVRLGRSQVVNVEAITQLDHQQVRLGTVSLPISSRIFSVLSQHLGL